MEIIALYPGQGSQQRGMGLSLYEASERVRTLFKEVSEIAERDMYTLLSEGSDGDLTTYAQLVITLVNRSAHLRLSELGTTIRVHAGFSLGELSAYAAASILDDATLFQIILTRMAMMETLSAKARDTHGELVMAAAIGLDYPAIEAVLEGERITDLWPANDNAPLQVVLSGTRSGLERARQPLFQAGVRRLIPLKVSGPFHPVHGGGDRPLRPLSGGPPLLRAQGTGLQLHRWASGEDRPSGAGQPGKPTGQAGSLDTAHAGASSTHHPLC